MSLLTVIAAGQDRVGGVLSSMVTVAVHWEKIPLATSLTVSVTVFAPKSEQLKSVFEAEKLIAPHAPDEPPSKSVARILTFPEASKNAVIFWQTATGGLVPPSVIAQLWMFIKSALALTPAQYILLPP